MTAGFVVAGVYAVGWLRGRRDRYHRLGFTVPFTVAAIVHAGPVMLGDSIARAVFHKQPVKFAAMEIVWKTDTHVPEYIFGRLHPDGIDLRRHQDPLTRLDPGRVQPEHPGDRADRRAGRRPADAPAQATIAHWAFDIMVMIGTLLLVLALWYALALAAAPRPAALAAGSSAARRWPASAAVVAVECGWITTEVGRQPWIVYGYMRVAEAVTRTVERRSIWIVVRPSSW